MKLYDFEVINNKGEKEDLNKYKGKTLLIVNTATKCGFTPQYKELEELYEKYNKDGFELLDFPSNQFKDQAPGSDEEITEFCTLNYGTTFPRFKKIDVKGETAIPLYKYLISQKGFKGFHPLHALSSKLEEIIGKEHPNFKNEDDIKWNFTKFLIDKEGNVIERFEPTEDMMIVEEKIKRIL